MTRIKTGALAAAGVALLVALTGCGTVNSGGASSSTKSNVKDVTIGFLQREVDAPYYSAMQKEAEGLAKKEGFKLVFQNAASDPVTQLNQAQTMLSQGVDAIIVNAVDPNSEKKQLTSLASKIPLLFLDTGIPGVGVTSVSSDNVKDGKLSGALAAKRFTKGSTITVAILNGGPTDAIVGPARQQGFLEGLKSGGVDYNIVASAPGLYAQDTAVTASQSLLAAHPDVDLILGLNDSMTLGALKVLQDTKNTHTLVAASADGQKQALEQIMKGCSAQYVSTGLNSPSIATTRAFQIATSLATGKSKASDYQPNEYTKAAGINCDNIKDYYDANSVF
ncbi:ribose transport system substrate-binding protein [Glaciihabitans sp. UYNi722]